MQKDNNKNKDYEGVVYTPSKNAMHSSNLNADANTTKPKNVARKKSKRQEKSQFAIFYAITLFTGVVICIVVFAVVFNSVLKKDPNNTISSKKVTASAEPEETSVAKEPLKETTGIVKSIGEKQIVVFDVVEKKSYTLYAEPNSVLKNKYGQAIVFAEITIGDLVDLSFQGADNKINTLTLSTQAFEYKFATNVKIDVVDRKITIGNDQYNYNDDLMVLFKGAPYNISDIKPIDLLTLRGFKDDVWFIEINKTHGYIDFTNKDKVKDGVVEIDTSNIVALNKDTEKIEVLEGFHRIVVKGSNIEPFVKELQIDNNSVVSIDLQDVQNKMGIINVTANEKDYRVLIDNEAVSLTEPIVLEYGEYSITVEKDGFVPWTGKVNLNQPIVDVKAEILQEIKTSKVRIDTVPSGADIYIDNVYIGVSPVSVDLEYGPKKIIPKKQGYLIMSYDIDVTLSTHSYEISLRQENPLMP